MKAVVLAVLVCTAMCSAGCNNAVEAVDTSLVSETSTVSFSIDGMMCEESCAKSVQEILASQPGVEKATVNFEAKTATCIVDNVEFNSAAAIAELDDKEFAAVVKSD